MQLLLGTLAPNGSSGPGNQGISAFDPAVCPGLLNESFVVKLLLVTKSLQQAAVNPEAGLSTPTCY